ncbi:hypothetical protein ACE6H2_021357 [Prunus campanulata]
MLDSHTAVYDILVLSTWNSDVNTIELLQVTPLLRGERNRARIVLEAEQEIEFGKFWRISALDDKMMRSNGATNVYGFFLSSRVARFFSPAIIHESEDVFTYFKIIDNLSIFPTNFGLMLSKFMKLKVQDFQRGSNYRILNV